VKEYRIGVANNVAAAALALDGKLDQALALHAQHPLQKRRDAIVQRGEFQTYTDFFFGVADVFLNAAAGKPLDLRWRPLFEKEPNWQLPELERNNFRSYRNFTLGLLDLSTGVKEEGQTLIMLAAKQRIDNFDKVLGANLEGFQLPSLVDRIVIGAGLTAGVKLGGNDSINLMLRGSEVLGRNLRHHLVDVAALLGVQPDIRSRREVHAYLHLLNRKREWELDKVRKLMVSDPSLEKKGAIIDDYSKAITTIANLKEKLRNRGTLSAVTLPTLEGLQRSLKDGQAYVSYHPFFGGIAKTCVTRGDAIYTIGEFTPELVNDAQLLVSSVTTYPKDAVQAQQFPAGSAVRLYQFLFGGLERCLVPGTHAIVALPPDFSGVPLGALLREEPPNRDGTFDLRQAKWLIRDLSFSIVISARHYHATVADTGRRSAKRPYLGVGDPYLAGDHSIKLATTELFRTSAKTQRGILDFSQLPETADELRSAARLFNANDSDILLGLRGTEESFRAKPVSEYDILHFATHGLVKGEVPGLSDSALVLTPGTVDDKFDDGLLSAAEISRLSLNARLIILSACNTAKYDVTQASRSVQDLQAAFTVAGAPTLLASLWPVDSLATKELVTGFLAEWRARDSKGAADALARAMRGFLERSDTLLRHPSFWAPFVVVGNGGVVGTSAMGEAVPPITFEFLDGFSTGGEIFDVVAVGSDHIFSMIGEWDGSKMNGIISRRAASGAEKWRVASREVGAGRILTAGNILYASGYTTTQNPIPVVRSFDLTGRPRWKHEFSDLRDYTLADMAATHSGALVVSYPWLRPTSSTHDVFVLFLGKDGKLVKKVQIDSQAPKLNPGRFAAISNWNEHVVVVLNSGVSVSAKFDKRTFSGLPTTCFEGGAATVHVLDRTNLRVVSSKAIPDFRANSLEVLDGVLFIGGEALENCSFRGAAALVRLERSGNPEVIWKDDDLFVTSVRGMLVDRKQLVIAVAHERTLGMRSDEPEQAQDFTYNKRWSDDLATARETSIVHLSKEGRVLERQYVGGGFGAFVQGLVAGGKHLIAYGSMGGLPAYTPTPRNTVGPEHPPHKKQPKAKMHGGWRTEVIVNH
jgi:hypothetical protein